MINAIRERIARALLNLAAKRAKVTVVLPDGSRFAGPRSDNDVDQPRIELREPRPFIRRLAKSPKIGIGESYTAGQWSPAPGTDLADVLTPFAAALTTMFPSWLLRLRRIADTAIPDNHHGSKEHSQDNIAAHYDLSNEMFAAFLDPTMSYSSARFDHERPLSDQSLTEAQLRKVHAALDLVDVQEGMHILEIGTGWGALAIEAARRGATVTTVTLSIEQAALARERIAAEGLSDHIDVVIQDYREVRGRYDAVISIEMIEAVGERYWAEYFQTLARLVKPDGAVCLQSILMSHERYLATRNSFSWIQKHIFPGGLIPSSEAIHEHASTAGLTVVSSDHFGEDYAETLHRWRSAFIGSWRDIESESFGVDFQRTWEFYLAYSEAGFRTGYLDVAQIRLEPAAQ